MTRRVALLAALAGMVGLLATPAMSAPKASGGMKRFCYALETRQVSTGVLAACAGFSGGTFGLSTSRDGGKTWTDRPSTPQPPSSDRAISVVISPDYDQDHRIYVQFHSVGLYVTSDDGATLALLDPLGGSPNSDRATAFDHFATGATAGAGAVLLPNAGSAAFARNLHLPVAGSGNTQDRAFVQIGTGASSILVNLSSSYDTHAKETMQLAQCTEVVVCASTQTFEAGLTLVDFATGLAEDRRAVFLLATGDRVPSLWVLDPAKATARRITPFDTLVAKTRKTQGGVSAHGVVLSPGAVSVTVNGELWTSTDNGAHWRISRTPKQLRRIVSLGGNAMAATDGANALWCSQDAGRHWRERC